MTAPWVVVEVERVAHGGSCVAHADDGRVVFVRHALPGERVRAVVTDERTSFLRADAVEVLRASPHRVHPPCPWAGPGRCGGCDWQHADLPAQRAMKARVVAEQLQRLARIERDVVVEPVPGDGDGLRWRTRMRLAVDASGRGGLRRHRSHEVERIDDCLIAVDALDVPDVVRRTWPADAEVNVEASASGERAVSMGTPRETLTEVALGRAYDVPVGGFWQVHVGAADLLSRVVVEVADVQPEDRVLDLYCGVGLFAGVLAPHAGRVVAVEADNRAAQCARRNLADLGNVDVVHDKVDRWLRDASPPVDVVVLDPPRRGAGAGVVRRIAALSPRTIVYVACDPAALARDVATLGEAGYELDVLRAFDLFPMTAHVECVATFRPATGPICRETP